jgi:hypothetical protein
MSEETASAAGATGAAATDAASDKKTGDQSTTTTQGADKNTTALGADASGKGQGDKAATGDVKAKTAIDGVADGAAATAPAAFPDDWRKQLSKGDEKALKRLERYASPVAVAEALINAQDRIAKGLKPGLPADATPEQIAEYRALLGVPEKPEGYKVELANGRVIGEEDQPMVTKFLTDMHAANAPPAMVNAMLNSYYDLQDEQIEAREDRDIEQSTVAKQALREEYGAETKANMAAIAGMLDAAPTGVGETLRSARGQDGALLLNDVNTVRWLVQMAKAANPAATVAPGSSGNAAQTVADEMTRLKADINNPESDYHKAPMILRDGIKDTPKAHRYRELLAAQERLEAAGKVAKAA